MATSAAQSLVLTQVYGGGGGSSTNASYKNDFVEIFNNGTSAVDLSQYSIQYGSSGSSASPNSAFSGIAVLANPASGKLMPGQYFLVALGSTGSGGATLAGADLTNASVNMAAAAGKVALVQGTTLLSASGSCSSSSIVDLVGYGTVYPSTCAAGGAPTAATSVSTSALRTVSCTNTMNNGADFTVGPTTAPRNSSTTLAPCSSGGSSQPTTLSISSVTFSPSSIMQGGNTTYKVVLSPGTNSGSPVVTVNLSSLGGPSAAQLPSSGNNTYSFSYTAPSNTNPGAYTVQVKVTSNDPTVTGSATLTVNAATVTTPIATIQANRSTYVGQTIQTQGVVTLITASGYYLQTQSATPGSTGDEGIYVYTGTAAKPAAIVVGNLVTISGTLTQYPAATASHTPSLEVTSAAVVSSTTGTVPAPIVLPAQFPTAGGGIYQLKQYESMLVTLPSLTATGPTDGNLVETTETVTSTGQFYAVATGTNRPFREPGMDFRDYPAATCPTQTNCTATTTSAGVTRPSAVVLYDDNPERLIVETALGGGTALDVSTGAVLTNVTGVVDFTYSTDVPYGDPARILVTPGSITAANYTPGISVQPLAVPGAGQVTVAAFNIERFFNTNAADNKYYNAGTQTVGGSSAVNVTQAAYSRRLAKLSLAIRNVLNTPDVVALEEVENISVIQDIAAQIDADATAAGQPAPGYVAYGTDSSSTYTDDVGGISVGFLVKPGTTNVVSWQQIGNQSTFAASSGTQTLNDRPSQVLHVGFKRANGASDYLMTLIVNHLRSLSGINSSADTRLKKELQAEALATAIQGYQSAGERVLAFGDMNAFEFSDGYTDTLGTITGNPSSAGTSVQAGPSMPIVTPAATDLVTLLQPQDRHSYVEFGNAQVLDHVIATANVVSNTTLAYAHLNADFPVAYTNDATTPARTSDHDAALTYLNVPAPIVSGTLTGSGTFSNQMVGSTSTGQQFVLTNTGEAPIVITSITTTGDFGQSNNCGNTLAINTACQINVVFVPSTTGARTGTLTVSSTATISPVTLTGTGTNSTETVTLGGLSATYDGNAHAATATTSPDTVAVAITYNGSSTAPTAAGSYAVVATVNQTGYIGSATGTLVIAKATAPVALANLTATYDGNPHAASATTIPAGLNTTVTYNGAAIAPTAAGTYAVVATVNDGNYTGTATGTLSVNKATAPVVLGNLTATYDGNAHAASVTTTPAGLNTTVTYNGAAIAPTAAGTYTVAATVNDNNYTGTATGNLVISAASVPITFTVANHTYGDAPFSVSATSFSAGGFTYSVVSGPASVSGSTVTLTGAGTVVLQAAQAASGNYAANTSQASFTIAKATPTVNFAAPAAVVYGTALSATQLNATASTAGTFTYTPAAGTVLNAGSQTLTVQFTPASTANFNTPAAVATTIVVNPSATTTSLATSSASANTGVTLTFTATVAAASGPVPTGAVVFRDGTTTLGTATLSNGVATYSTSTLSAAAHTITATYQGNGNDAVSSGSITQTVTVPAVFSFNVSSSGVVGASTGSYSVTVQRGSAAQLSFALTPSSTFSGTVTFSCMGLPANTSCEFTPSTLTLATGSSVQTISLLLRTSTLNAAVQPQRNSTGSGLVLAFTLPGLLLAGLGVRSRRAFGNSRLLLVGFLLLGLAGTFGLTGCGTTTTQNFTNTRAAAAGTTTFTVVATSGTVSQTIPVTLTIQ